MKSQPTKTTSQTKLQERCGFCQKPKVKSPTILTKLLAQEACECVDVEKPESSRSAEFSPGELPDLGENFEALEYLGQGGMGLVFKARSRADNKIYAVKVMHSNLSDDKEAVKRFEQEISAVSKLDHANLIAVHSHHRTRDGVPFLVMDYIEGQTLAEYIRDTGAVPDSLGIDIFTDLAEALSSAHENGVIHRDIKPGNVLLVENSSGSKTAKLADFGIAKLMPTESSAGRETQDLTKTGDIFGTPNYMSPEQCLGFKLDHRSDIYSLGCLMYEVLTGRAPFAGENPIQIVIKQINDLPSQWVINKDDNLRLGLEFVVFRCLEKDPDHRYQSTRELIDDLNKLKNGERVGTRSRTKPSRANLSRLQILTLSMLSLFCLGQYNSMTLGLGVDSPGLLFCLPMAAIYLWQRRKKIWLPQPENKQWVVLRAVTFMLMIILQVMLGLASSGVFEFLPQSAQPALISLFVMEIFAFSLFAGTVCGELFSKDEQRVTLRPVAIKMLLFSIPMLVLSAFTLPTMLSSCAREIVSPISSHDGLISVTPAAPKFAKSLMETQLQFSNDTETNPELIRLLTSEKKFDEAEKWLNRVITKHPEIRPTKIQLAMLHNAEGKPDQALAELDSLETKLYKERGDTASYRAQIEFDRGNYKRAADYYTQMIKQSYSYNIHKIYVDKAAALWRNGDKQEAIDNLSMAIKKCYSFDDPEQIYVFRGLLYESMNNPTAAKKDFEDARAMIADSDASYAPNPIQSFQEWMVPKSYYKVNGLMIRSFLYAKIGDSAKSQEYLRAAESLGTKKADFLKEFSEKFGVKPSW